MSSSPYTFHHDVEKNVRVIDTGSAHSGGVVTEGEGEEKKHSSISYTDGVGGAVPGESFAYGNSWYAKMQRLAGKLNVEQRGIERVPENERTDDGFKALLNVATMVCFFLVSLPLTIFPSNTNHKSEKTVAISKHGSILLRNRNPLQIPLLPRFRRLHPRLPLLQPHRHNPRLLLLDLRPQIRSSTNGPLAFLVRLVGSQTDRHLQRFSLYRLVLCEFHCGRRITAYGK